jgi:hypothetical protein
MHILLQSLHRGAESLADEADLELMFANCEKKKGTKKCGKITRISLFTGHVMVSRQFRVTNKELGLLLHAKYVNPTQERFYQI